MDAQLLPKIVTPQGPAMAAAAGVVAGATEVAKLSVLLLRSRSALLLRSRSGYKHLGNSTYTSPMKLNFGMQVQLTKNKIIQVVLDLVRISLTLKNLGCPQSRGTL